MLRLLFWTAIARLCALIHRFWGGKSGAPEPACAVPGTEVRRFRAALSKLPADTRAIFLLHRAEGVEIPVIAERTGHSTAVVEQHIANAVLAISTALDADQT